MCSRVCLSLNQGVRYSERKDHSEATAAPAPVAPAAPAAPAPASTPFSAAAAAYVAPASDDAAAGAFTIDGCVVSIPTTAIPTTAGATATNPPTALDDDSCGDSDDALDNDSCGDSDDAAPLDPPAVLAADFAGTPASLPSATLPTAPPAPPALPTAPLRTSPWRSFFPFHLFLTAFSVLPGMIRAMFLHRLPSFAWA